MNVRQGSAKPCAFIIGLMKVCGNGQHNCPFQKSFQRSFDFKADVEQQIILESLFVAQSRLPPII